MACPFFEPLKLRVDAKAFRPLGDYWLGVCHASTEALFEPDEHLLSECCNMGYARGKCSRFPPGDVPDAVRFTVARDSGETIMLSFALEKDHYPHAHGLVEYSRAASAFTVPHPDGLIEQQARAYVASYLRRTTL